MSHQMYMCADDTKIYRPMTSHEDTTILQHDLDCLQSWSAKWLLNLHKCKVMSIIKSKACNHECADYYLKNHSSKTSSIPILRCTEEIDLSVVFDIMLSFRNHINMSINKANRLLEIVRRSFCALDNNSFTLLYKAIVRPHLEYAATIWNPYKEAILKTCKGYNAGYQTSSKHFTFKLSRASSCS